MVNFCEGERPQEEKKRHKHPSCVIKKKRLLMKRGNKSVPLRGGREARAAVKRLRFRKKERKAIAPAGLGSTSTRKKPGHESWPGEMAKKKKKEGGGRRFQKKRACRKKASEKGLPEKP